MYKKNYLKNAIKNQLNTQDQGEKYIQTRLRHMWFNSGHKQKAVLDAVRNLKNNGKNINDALNEDNNELKEALQIKRYTVFSAR